MGYPRWQHMQCIGTSRPRPPQSLTLMLKRPATSNTTPFGTERSAFEHKLWLRSARFVRSYYQAECCELGCVATGPSFYLSVQRIRQGALAVGGLRLVQTDGNYDTDCQELSRYVSVAGDFHPSKSSRSSWVSITMS